MPGTTIKDAIKKWEEKHPGENIAEAEEVGFQFQMPPIEKMDNSLAALANVRFVDMLLICFLAKFISSICIKLYFQQTFL